MRSVLAFAAALILQGTTDLNVFLLSLIAVFSSVAVLQSFVVKIAGQNVIDLSSFMDTYRVRMIKAESDRVARDTVASAMKLRGRLSSTSIEELKSHLRIVLLETQSPAAVATTIEGLTSSAQSAQFLAQIYATQIVFLNESYARGILADAAGATGNDT